MTEAEFWTHIDQTRTDDPDDHGDELAVKLASLSVDEILSFRAHWRTMHIRAYSWSLWGAAYLINGGCSDDGFEYFCDWLILQGETVFNAAINDPESLADILDGDAEVELEAYPAYDAYMAVSGQGDYFDAFMAKYPDLRELPELGPRFDFDDDDEMKRRYPKLFAAYVEELY